MKENRPFIELKRKAVYLCPQCGEEIGVVKQINRMKRKPKRCGYCLLYWDWNLEDEENE